MMWNVDITYVTGHRERLKAISEPQVNTNLATVNIVHSAEPKVATMLIISNVRSIRVEEVTDDSGKRG